MSVREDFVLHCMVAWGSPVAGTPLQPSDHAAMEAALAPYAWVRAFPGVMVVRIGGEPERVDLQNKLTVAAKSLGNRVHVLISPVLGPSNGIYRGFLASTLWEQLNTIAVD